MKKTILTIASLALAFSMNAQGISDKAAYDDFKSKSPIAVVTTETSWDTLNNAPGTAKAYKGIYFWEKAKSGGLDFSKTRSGNGVLAYTANQAESAYEPSGVGFGEYAKDGVKTPFTLDLTSNSVVSFTVKNTSSVKMEFRVALQDINDTTLNAYAVNSDYTDATASDLDITGSGFYKNELRIVVEAAASKNVSIDFSKGAHVYYKVGETGCKNVEYATLNDKFNFAKVKAFTITPLNEEGTGDGSFPKCWGKVALVSGTYEISNFKIGDQTTIVGVSDEIITEFKSGKVNAYNLSTGALVASGSVEEVAANLENGVYVFKQGSLTKKVAIVK